MSSNVIPQTAPKQLYRSLLIFGAIIFGISLLATYLVHRAPPAANDAAPLERAAIQPTPQYEVAAAITATATLTSSRPTPTGIPLTLTTADDRADKHDDGSEVIQAAYTVYKNALSKGWEDHSWDANINFNGFPAYDGLTAMTINFTAEDGAVYLRASQPIPTRGYNVLRFFINGGSAGNQQLGVALMDGAEQQLRLIPLTPPYPNNWRQIDILLADLGNPTHIHGIVFQDMLGAPQPVLFIDEVALVDDPLAGSFKDNEINGPRLTIDAAGEQHEISPYIYGINFASEAIAREIELPLNRWGGNAVSRYNYLEDATNTGNNWYFQNIPPEKENPYLPHNSSADQFVQQNIRTNTESLMTLPLIGWVARADYKCGFSVEQYGFQIETDKWRPDCGAGVAVDGTIITGTNPLETSIPAGPDFVQSWVRHLTSVFDMAEEGGVRFYNLDNEPMIWSHTHRDVRSEPLGLDEFLDRTIRYAEAVKQIDPGAQLLGPVVWGWSSYFWSDVDVDDKNDPKVTAPDREAHDNLPLVAYYLRELKRYEDATGLRLLDYLDLHYYPQSPGVAFSDVGDESIQALRLRSTRSLWDPSYVDESWIGEPVMLIPRMRDWRDTYYPGTQLAITEYNWGGLEHINGAVAQADVLGIFGREDLDLAALWADQNFDQKVPGMFAFRIYRNYDGRHGKFGDISLAATSEDEHQLSVYAARRTEDDALTIVIINKTNIPLTSEVVVDNLEADREMNAFRYSRANLGAIERLVTPEVADGYFVDTFPPLSITMVTFTNANN